VSKYFYISLGWKGLPGTRVTRRLEKNSPNFSKNSPKSQQVKKGNNSYSKAQFESPKHLQQTML